MSYNPGQRATDKLFAELKAELKQQDDRAAQASAQRAQHNAPVHQQSSGPLSIFKANAEGLVVRVFADPAQTDENIRKGPLAQDFYFQCPPLESFTPNYGFAHTDVFTVGPGQVSRKNGRQLRVVTFNTLFVDVGSYQVAPYLGPGDHPPAAMNAMMRRLQAISESGSAIRVQAYHKGYASRGRKLNLAESHELVDPNGRPGWLTTLRAVTVSEKHGEGDARYISAEFHEYVDPLQQAREKGKGGHPTRAVRKGPWHHRLSATDSFYSLCHRYYHTEGKVYWDRILTGNVQKHPGLRVARAHNLHAPIVSYKVPGVHIGTSLLIPAKPSHPHSHR